MDKIMKIILIICITACFSFSGRLYAEISPNITYKYYQVKVDPGLTLGELILTSSPLREGDKPVPGQIYWGIEYNSIFDQPMNGICQLSQIHVVCSCEIRLPMLETTDSQLLDEYTRYLPTLKEHELTHCSIATKYAKKFKQQVNTITLMPCEEMENSIKNIFRTINKEAKSAQLLFDKQEAEKNHPAAPYPPPHSDYSSLSNIADMQYQEDKPGDIRQDTDGVWRNY